MERESQLAGSAESVGISKLAKPLLICGREKEKGKREDEELTPESPISGKKEILRLMRALKQAWQMHRRI